MGHILRVARLIVLQGGVAGTVVLFTVYVNVGRKVMECGPLGS